MTRDQYSVAGDSSITPELIGIRHVRQELYDELGANTVRELHVQSRWLDGSLLAILMGLFVGNFVLIAVGELSYIALLWVAVLQGWLIMALALLAHDLFTHRMVWRGFIGQFLATLSFLPALRSSAKYRVGHFRHHTKLLTDEDTEASLRCLNRRDRRLLFMTGVGFLLAQSGKWSPKEEQNGYEATIDATAKDLRIMKAENRCIVIFLLSVFVVTAAIDWKIGVFGYWLPVLIFAPAISTVRMIIEHSHVDPSNPYWLATPYKTGWFSKIVFVADSGDCHLVHHIFPRVPWYHVPRLVRLSENFLKSKGVVFEASLLPLLVGWFVHNYSIRTKWPLRTNPPVG